MGLSASDAFQASGSQRRRRRYGRGRRGTLSEINVTPLVDVMLVLLIIFMISAPLLTAGVPVELPKTNAASMQNQKEPITISIRADGSIFVQEDPVPFSQLSPHLTVLAGDERTKPIYVRADGRAAYETVAQVMAALSTSGFTSINLITDTGGPSPGEAQPSPPNPPAEAPTP